METADNELWDTKVNRITENTIDFYFFNASLKFYFN